MKTKSPPTYLGLLEEIVDKYGEWVEMGNYIDTILLSLLHKEREKNFDLQIKIEYLEKKVNV